VRKDEDEDEDDGLDLDSWSPAGMYIPGAKNKMPSPPN